MEPAVGLSDALMPPEGEAGTLRQRQPSWPWGLARAARVVRWGEEMLRLWSIPGRVATREGRGQWPGSVLWESPSGTTASLPAWPQAAGGHSSPRACTECPRGPRPANPGHMTVAGEAFCTRIGPAGSFLPFLAGVPAVCVGSRGKLPWPQVPSTPSPGEEAPLLSAAAHAAHRPGLSGGQRLSEALPKRPLPVGPAAPARPPCPACGAPPPPGLDHVRGSTSAWVIPLPGCRQHVGTQTRELLLPWGRGGQQAGGFQGVGLLPGTHADNTGGLGARGRAVRRPS